MRALFWKEWRENWLIVVLGIVVISLLNYLILINREFHPAFNDTQMVLLLVPLFIAILTANLFSTEIGHNTISFLFIFPASRTKIWLVKVLFGVAMVLLLIIGALFGIVLVSHLTPTHIQLEQFTKYEDFELFDIVTIGCLIYISTLFISILVSNTIGAVFGGLIFSIIIFFFWNIKTDILNILFYLPITLYESLWIPIVILLFSCWFTFVRSELMDTKQRTRVGLKVFIFCFIIYFGILGCAAVFESIDLVPIQSIQLVVPQVYIAHNNLVLVRVLKKEEDTLIWYDHPRLWLVSIKDKWYKKYPGSGYFLHPLHSTSNTSPDGKYILLDSNRRLFNLLELRQTSHKIYFMNTKTLQIQQVPVKQGLFLYYSPMAWTPDSRHLFCSRWVLKKEVDVKGDRFALVDIFSGNIKRFNAPQELLSAHELTYAPDGKSLYFHPFYSYDTIRNQNVSQIYQIGLAGNILWRNTQYDAITRPFISPDGKWLLFSQSTTEPGEWRKIYLRNLYTTETSFILAARETRTCFWSPDSKWIAIPALTSHTGTYAYSLWLINLATREKQELITEHNTIINIYRWSPDSRKIVYGTNRKGEGNKAIDIYTKEISSQIPPDYLFNEIKTEKWTTHVPSLMISDGSYIVSKGKQLVLVSADGKQTKQIFP